MSRNLILLALVGVVVFALEGRTDPRMPASRAPKPRATAPPSGGTKAPLTDGYATLPLTFEANRGQTDPRVDFLAHGKGYTLFLSSGEAALTLRSPIPPLGGRRMTVPPTKDAVIRMTLIGAVLDVKARGENELPGKANYLIGNDPTKWHTNVPTYTKVRYSDLYPGIDLTYYGNQGRLEYDFLLRPGADPAWIVIGFQGTDRLEVSDTGDLILRTPAGRVNQHRPVMYQEVDGVRRAIAGGYVLRGSHEVGFRVGAHDPKRSLVIDPVLVYSTYLGGTGDDQSRGIAVDGAGHAYVAGFTNSLDYPTTLGVFNTIPAGSYDVFVTKLNPLASGFVYSTYIGGSGDDMGLAITIDAAGNAYLTGSTASPNFPTTPGAFQTSKPGLVSAFVTKLNGAGSGLLYSTYLGGNSADAGTAIALDPSGSAYIMGFANSHDFPTTPGAFQTTFGGVDDAFVAKLNASGSSLIYSTYLGGVATEAAAAGGIAVDTALNAYVTGGTNSPDFPTTPGAFQTVIGANSNAWVTKLNSTGSALVYSTFLGSTSNAGGNGIVVDPLGNAHVVGSTSGATFPTTAGSFQTTFGGAADAFLTTINPSGSALLFSTYLGGSSVDEGRGVALDSAGNSYIVGFTSSADFPSLNAIQLTYGGVRDAFVTKLNSTGSAVVYSTYLGGTDDDLGFGIALDVSTNPSAYVTGTTTSADFPSTPGTSQMALAGSNDGFVGKIASSVGTPATLTLSPPAATNPVETQHCVTATVQDAGGNPVPDVTVRFTVTGSVSASGSQTTDQNGQATFCYMGPSLPGSDAITAYADTDNDNTQDPDEPAGTAAKAWVLPTTTPLCEIKISNGGWFIATNGDRASFGGNAKSSDSGQTQGQEQYQDHGPAQPLNVNSINVLAIVCDGTTQASIYGQATIDGSGSFYYRIKVRDMGEPGVGMDTYWMLLQNGYNSGEHTLLGGNVQINRN